MSDLNQINQGVARLAIGSVAVLMGDTVSLKDVSYALYELAIFGGSLSKKSPYKAAFRKAVANVGTCLKSSPEFSTLKLDELRGLVDSPGNKRRPIDSQALRNALRSAQNHDLCAPLVQYLYEGFAFDGHSDITKRALKFSLTSALTELLNTEEIQNQMQKVALIELVQDLARFEHQSDVDNKAICDTLDAILNRLRSARSGLPTLSRKRLDGSSDDIFVKMSFEARLTQFLGRDEEIEKLKEFVASDQLLSWWQVSGQAGQGKSRLALHFLDHHLDKGWYGGFWQTHDLGNVNWAEVVFHEPTLVVIDYIAGKDKAETFIKALGSLHERANGTALHPLEHKLRILILERDGFGLSTTMGPQGWLSPFQLKTYDKGILEDRVYDKDGALDLGDLDKDTMKMIARSWREMTGKDELDATQLDAIVDQMATELSGGRGRKRAWRPLFAMIFAELPDNSAAANWTMEDILENVIEQEKDQFWQMSGSPDAASGNLAALTTMIGELDLTGFPASTSQTHNTLQEAEAFYAAGDIDKLQQAWRVLGRAIHPKDQDLKPLLARTPDLLGEYMVIWLLKSCVEKTYVNPHGPDRILQLAQDAWLLRPDRMLDFVIRIDSDFSTSPVAKILTHAHLPESSPLLELPLTIASAFGLWGWVDQLIKAGRSINEVDPKNGAFPLLMAAQNGHAAIVEHLIRDGAEVNRVNTKDGAFPLLQAAQNGHAETVEQLIKDGAEVNRVNAENGAFPLLMAAQNGHAETVEQLIKDGAKVNMVHVESGAFPLLLAAQNGHAETVEQLIRDGAEVNRVNTKDGAFPLLQAAQNGHAETVEQLIKDGAKVNMVHVESGVFPLLQAAQEGHAAIVEQLIRDGADVNMVNTENGTFPLLQAAQQGHAATVEQLIRDGADVNMVNTENGTFPLLQAAQNGHATTVEQLIKDGAKVNMVNTENGTFPLLQAAQQGHAATVEQLIRDGADVNMVNTENGTFPLLQAAQQGHAATVEQLIKDGAKVNMVNAENGTFPLLQAAQNGHAATEALLLSNGARPLK